MEVEARLAAMGLALPPPVQAPPGVRIPFAFVRVRGNRVFAAGHAPQNPDGSIAGPYGRVGEDVAVEQAREAARLTALSMLGSLQRELGDLDRISAWLRVFGMVRCTPDFQAQPQVLNGFSDLILEVFGPEVGRHARSAVGMISLPFGICVEVEAELEIDG